MSPSSLPPANVPVHNILLTIPRTASNLVIRLLDLPNQASIVRHQQYGYYFLPALMHRYQHDTFTRPIEEWSHNERSGMDAILRTCCDQWCEGLESAEHTAGKGTFTKEHIHWMIKPEIESQYIHGKSEVRKGKTANPTCIPTPFLLRRVRPTLLIRDPALTFPSLMRTAIDNEGLEALLTESSEKTMRWEATYHWHVSLYKFLLASNDYPRQTLDPNITYPIILDAYDLSDPDLVRRYATVVGLDPKVVRFQWDAEGREGMADMEARMKDTLMKSNGVVLEKLKTVRSLQLEETELQWKVEFGNVLGARVARLVDDARADYEWLWERRTRFLKG